MYVVPVLMPSLSNYQLSIDKLVPCVGHSRQAPMATVLVPLRRPSLFLWQVLLPVHWRVSIFPVVGHSCNVEVIHRSFHSLHHWFQNAHLWWISAQISLILNRLSFSVTRPTWIPPSTARKTQSTSRKNRDLMVDLQNQWNKTKEQGGILRSKTSSDTTSRSSTGDGDINNIICAYLI